MTGRSVGYFHVAALLTVKDCYCGTVDNADGQYKAITTPSIHNAVPPPAFAVLQLIEYGTLCTVPLIEVSIVNTVLFCIPVCLSILNFIIPFQRGELVRLKL